MGKEVDRPRFHMLEQDKEKGNGSKDILGEVGTFGILPPHEWEQCCYPHSARARKAHKIEFASERRRVGMR
jgi:hypothetical protein